MKHIPAKNNNKIFYLKPNSRFVPAGSKDQMNGVYNNDCFIGV